MYNLFQNNKKIKTQRCRLAQGYGYRLNNELLHRLWTLTMLLPVFISALPIILILHLFLLITQGRPVIYKGLRLGKHKKPFIIYKFRTLAMGAEQKLKADVLPARSGLETRFGKFLRDTRLDELPQLFNILKGNMNFIGPRPVRPDIVEHVGHKIKNYNFRFTVRPGLIGHTQLFTTHRTSKRLRAKFNAYFCTKKACFYKEPFIMFITVYGMIQKTGFLLKDYIFSTIKTGSFFPRRQTIRIKSKSAAVSFKNINGFFIPMQKEITGVFLAENPDFTTVCMIKDINDEAFTFFTFKPFPKGSHQFDLIINISGTGKWIKARCTGEAIIKDLPDDYITSNPFSDPVCFNIIYYQPITDFDFYKIDKYFLKNSILI